MKKALVLGGTVPHAYLIDKLKAKGYTVILIDYTENPPAKSHADVHLRESSLDPEKVLEIAKSENADLVISTCIDQANSTACYVGERLSLPIPYSYETSLDVTRKGRMKTIFRQYGIPTSDFYILEKDEPKAVKLEYPIVIKPTDANSSKGVFKITSDREFEAKIEESFAFSREGKTIVERFVPGTEIQVDCIAVNGKASVLMTRDKIALPVAGKELQVLGFSIPGKLCTAHRAELEAIAQKIATAFGLQNTPFFYQAICNENGVFVLEFAPRIAGGTTFDMVQQYSGVDYLENAVRSFTGEPLDVQPKPCGRVYVTRFLYMKSGVFGAVKGLDELLSSNDAYTYFPFVLPGKTISDNLSSGNRIGGIMAKAPDYETAERLIRHALETVSVTDMDGKDRSFWKE